jgi:hypothetical protein
MRRVPREEFLEPFEPGVRGRSLPFFGGRRREKSSARVIEGDDRIESQEERVGDAAFPRMAIGNVLEGAGGVVGQEADRSTDEWRQVGVGLESIAESERLERGQERQARDATPPVFLDLDTPAVKSEPGRRRDAEEAVPRNRLSSFDALEQEALGAGRAHPPEEVDRRSTAERELARDGDDAAPL